MTSGNLFEQIPERFSEEVTELLASGKGDLRIERIISRGHRSPSDFWYDQDTSEWVLILKGEGELIFEDSNEPVTLKPGDWIEIPAHRRHRVASTSEQEDTVWLAVHWK